MRVYKALIQIDKDTFIPYIFLIRRKYGREEWLLKALDLSNNTEHTTATIRAADPFAAIVAWTNENEAFDYGSITSFSELKL